MLRSCKGILPYNSISEDKDNELNSYGGQEPDFADNYCEGAGHAPKRPFEASWGSARRQNRSRPTPGRPDSGSGSTAKAGYLGVFRLSQTYESILDNSSIYLIDFIHI